MPTTSSCRALLSALAIAAAAAAMLMPNTALAQYRNMAYGFDVGAVILSRPSVLATSTTLEDTNARPVRLSNGFRFGGHGAFKMLDPHWWIGGRFDLGVLFWGHSNNQLENDFDRLANHHLGAVL